MRIMLTWMFAVCSFSGLAQIVIDAEKNVDFRKFKTFVVQQGQVIYQSNERKKDEKRIFAILKDAITKELTARGYEVAGDSSAELSVSYVYQERGVATTQNGGPLGQTPVDNPVNVDVAERTTTINTDILILEIEQIKNKNSLWTATCTMNDLQRDLAKTLSPAVASAFKKFPARNKKK